MNLLGENYQTLPATGLKEEFFTCTKTKNHVCWLGRHLGKVCNKVFKWKNSKYFPIYGHVHHKWLAIFPAKPIKRAGIKKNDSFCFTMMSWSVEGLLLSRCLSFHWNTISGLMLMYTVAPWSKFTASFVVIRIVFEVQISITEIICIVNTQSTCKIVKHKVHVKHLNCTCTLYLKSLKKYFL